MQGLFWIPALRSATAGMTSLVAGLINCGAERQHYSMFDVGRSMFDVQSVRCPSFCHHQILDEPERYVYNSRITDMYTGDGYEKNDGTNR